MVDPRPEPIIVADDLGLDFLNTIVSATGASVDALADGAGLMNWLETVDAVPPDRAKALVDSAIPGELDKVAAQARDLREWFRAFVLAHKGRSLDPATATFLEPLNRLLSRDELYGSIGVAKHPVDREGHNREHLGFAWIWHRRWTTPESLLQPIARAMAELVCDADFAHVKQCEGQGCVVLFHDKTKSRARRWCTMALCGNRAKQAAHRQRIKTKIELHS